LTTQRHNKVHRGEAIYRCRCCSGQLVFAGVPE
jgi:predicted SprT family Zn-dependent metalloprotease